MFLSMVVYEVRLVVGFFSRRFGRFPLMHFLRLSAFSAGNSSCFFLHQIPQISADAFSAIIYVLCGKQFLFFSPADSTDFR